MISNIKVSGVAVTSMPSFRAGYAVAAAGVVAAAHAGSAAAARVGVVAAAAVPAERHLPVANAVWPPVAGIAAHKRRAAAAMPRASVDWSPPR
ncbi:hypothetical protein [Mycobacterium sp. 141]|uniref:hypothetical protein n=1 Tax=Mycobacterium sp. 141 TaxID=1120797 RepID=UPI0003A5D708|nr:hypothetical protein [Mycobacterium sp. 141]